MDVAVVVATFGGPEWADLARARAIPSALAQGVRVHHVHGDTLHEARNEGIATVDAEFVCVLDADDELVANYFTNMARGTCDVRAPAVQYVRTTGHISEPFLIPVAGHTHACTAECLPYGNWIVIGACARRDLVLKVGGFKDWPWSEDWDLWVRMWAAGATFEHCEGAIYRAHARDDSRNRGASTAVKMAVHRQIARANGLPVPA